jgi:hypothetical protein
MEDANNLVGQFALLPSGDKVIVESVERDSSSALVRRIDGPLAGMPAVCVVSKLEPLGRATSEEFVSDPQR